MHCNDYLRLISGHLDGANSEVEERLLRQHLKQCRHCRELLALMEENDAKIAELGTDAPPELAANIMAAVRKEPKKHPAARRRFAALGASGLAAAALLAFVLFGGLELPMLRKGADNAIMLDETASADNAAAKTADFYSMDAFTSYGSTTGDATLSLDAECADPNGQDEAVRQSEGMNAPQSTAETPETTSEIETTQTVTTQAPEATEANTTTQAPETTEPDVTTQAPETTEPDATTQAPVTTEPDMTTQAPEATETDATTQTSEETQASETAQEPEPTETDATTQAPETTEPDTPTSAPDMESEPVAPPKEENRRPGSRRPAVGGLPLTPEDSDETDDGAPVLVLWNAEAAELEALDGYAAVRNGVDKTPPFSAALRRNLQKGQETDLENALRERFLSIFSTAESNLSNSGNFFQTEARKQTLTVTAYEIPFSTLNGIFAESAGRYEMALYYPRCVEEDTDCLLLLVSIQNGRLLLPQSDS